MELDNQQIGDVFRKAFRDFEQKPDPVVWKGVSRQLLVRRILRISYTWVAPALVVAFAVGWFLYPSAVHNKPAVPVTNERSVTPVKTQEPAVVRHDVPAQTAPEVENQPGQGKDEPQKKQASQSADSRKDSHTPESPSARSVAKVESVTPGQPATVVPASSHQAKPDASSGVLHKAEKEVAGEQRTVANKQKPVVAEAKPDETKETGELPVISETTYAICAGEEVPLTAPEGWRYSWSTGDFARNIAVKPDETTSYEVIVEDREGNQSVARFTVDVLDCSIFVPKAFSPNNDGSNDLFLVRGEGITQFEMKVFSKWGELVFETRDIFQGWDGNLRGTRAPVDAYIYQIRFTDEAGNWHNVQGSVTLVP